MAVPVDPRRLDEVAARATPGAVEEAVAGWRCRCAPDLPFRRANAVLPPVAAAAAPTDDAAAALDAVEAWYRQRDRRVVVQVSDGADPSGRLDRLLAERGYEVEAPVDVLVASLPAGPIPDRGGSVWIGRGDADFARRHRAVHGDDRAAAARTDAYGRMLEPFGRRAIGAAGALDDDGRLSGIGWAVIDGDLVGVFGMATAPWARRRGVAAKVLRTLLEVAGAEGATAAYLQLEADNDAARALYERAGFERSHSYHYRVSGPAPADELAGC